jgi:predicted AAA+ superfamily ATPase
MGMARPALRSEVPTKGQRELRKLVSGGVQQVRVVLRALALLQTLRQEANAWNRRMNRTRGRIAWKFNRKTARRKFG